MKQGILLIFLQILCLAAFAQQNSTDEKPKLNISAYMDLYYGYDFQKPNNHELRGYFFSYRRHNEVSLNLGLVKFSVDGGRYRANLGLAAGNYPEYNIPRSQLPCGTFAKPMRGVVGQAKQTLVRYGGFWLARGL